MMESPIPQHEKLKRNPMITRKAVTFGFDNAPAGNAGENNIDPVSGLVGPSGISDPRITSYMFAGSSRLPVYFMSRVEVGAVFAICSVRQNARSASTAINMRLIYIVSGANLRPFSPRSGLCRTANAAQSKAADASPVKKAAEKTLSCLITRCATWMTPDR